MSVVDVAICVDISLEAAASLAKSSSVPFTVLRTVAKDESKSMEVFMAAVPRAVTGAVIAVERKRPTIPVALELLVSALPTEEAACPMPVHADRAVSS